MRGSVPGPRCWVLVQLCPGIASLHTRGEGISGPKLPLKPPLPSLPSPEPALQKATLHPLNSQARSPPQRFPSCCFFVLTKSTVCKTVTHVRAPAQRPSYLPTPSYEGLPKLPLPPTDIGWATEGQLASGIPEVTRKDSGLPARGLPGGVYTQYGRCGGDDEWVGWEPSCRHRLPTPSGHPQEGTVAGPCRKGP